MPSKKNAAKSPAKKKADRVFKLKTRELAEGIERVLQQEVSMGRRETSYRIMPPKLHPNITPPGVEPAVMAMDNPCYQQGYFEGGYFNNVFFQGFPGYPYLSTLTTRPEYRQFADVNSMELTREWITLNSTGTQDKTIKKRIEIINAKMKDIDLRGTIRLAAEQIDFFGRSQLLIELEGQNLAMPLILSPKTVPKKSLINVKAIEPIWTTPSNYDAIFPGAPDFYKPYLWYMMGQAVHATRLITIITRAVPDILKPAFNFSGISLSQLAEPYVNNWIRARQSISDLINNFSILALQTDMAQILQDGDSGQTILNRAKLFTQTRSNQGLMLLDKNQEELIQLAVPLSGLNELQSQAQEHMCTVSAIPSVKLLGISPSGFNATPDGEIRTFYDKKAAEQEAFWRKPIETVMKIIMLSEFGEIDDSINFSFNPLWQMDKKQEAEIRNLNAQAAGVYLDRGVFSPDEMREVLARDPDSLYNGVDISDLGTGNQASTERVNLNEQEKEPYEDGENQGS